MQEQNACRKLVICDTLCRSCHICNNGCPGFEREFCSRIARAPYVCNGCNKPRHLCTIQTKYNYNARTSIFYCDPMRSCQKGGIENVHTMLRMILPKGTVYENFTQWDIRKAVDHVNNAPRRKLGGRTPYEPAVKTFGVEALQKLQLRYVAPDEMA